MSASEISRDPESLKCRVSGIDPSFMWESCDGFQFFISAGNLTGCEREQKYIYMLIKMNDKILWYVSSTIRFRYQSIVCFSLSVIIISVIIIIVNSTVSTRSQKGKG